MRTRSHRAPLRALRRATDPSRIGCKRIASRRITSKPGVRGKTRTTRASIRLFEQPAPAEAIRVDPWSKRRRNQVVGSHERNWSTRLGRSSMRRVAEAAAVESLPWPTRTVVLCFLLARPGRLTRRCAARPAGACGVCRLALRASIRTPDRLVRRCVSHEPASVKSVS